MGEKATPDSSRSGPPFEAPEHMNDGLALAIPEQLVDAIATRVLERIAAREPDEPEPWIGVDQAADHLACPKSRIYALASAGRIPHEKDCSRLLFRRSELDAWLARGGGKRP